MSEIYIPPFANIRLIECHDYMALTPVADFREFFAYGKKKAREATFEREDGTTELFWDDCSEDEEVWAVVQWRRYEDGCEVPGSMSFLRAPATEEDARDAMRRLSSFYELSRDELVALSQCFKATDHGRPVTGDTNIL